MTMLSSSYCLLLLVLIISSSINDYITNPFNKIIKRNSNNILKSEIIERKETITISTTTTTTTQPIDVSQITYSDMNSFQLKPVNEYDFDEIINDDIVVCLLYAPWAGPCKTMEKTLITDVVPLYNTHEFKFIKIDTDNSIDLVNRLSIRSIPSTLIFKNGQIVSEIIGSVSGDVVNQHLSLVHVNNDESFQ